MNGEELKTAKAELALALAQGLQVTAWARARSVGRTTVYQWASDPNSAVKLRLIDAKERVGINFPIGVERAAEREAVPTRERGNEAFGLTSRQNSNSGSYSRPVTKSSGNDCAE